MLKKNKQVSQWFHPYFSFMSSEMSKQIIGGQNATSKMYLTWIGQWEDFPYQTVTTLKQSNVQA